METTGFLRFPEPHLRLQTEKVGSRLWERSCSILFLEIGGKYRYNRKNRCKKICNSKLLSHLENTEFRFPVKAHPILHLLWPNFVWILRLIDLLRGLSSSLQCASAVACPNKTNKEKFIENSNAKLQPPQYGVNSSRDMNVQLVNIDATDSNHQEAWRDAWGWTGGAESMYTKQTRKA